MGKETKVRQLRDVHNTEESESMDRWKVRLGEERLEQKIHPKETDDPNRNCRRGSARTDGHRMEAFLGGRLGRKWQEALEHHHGERIKQDPTVKLTPSSSLIENLWEMRLQQWRSQNEMKHGKTPEERDQKLWAKLDPKIRRAYTEQYWRITTPR